MASRPANVLENEARYRNSHREEINLKRKAYYYRNRERCLAYSKKYWEEHPELRKKHYERRAYRIATNAEAHARRNEVARQGMFRLRQEILVRYGTNCSCCGETRNEFLCIDHINGCTKELRKLQGGGNTFYRWLKKNNFPSGYQVLCHNCNMAKGFHGECPHVKERGN